MAKKKNSKNGKMSKSEIFRRFFGHNSDIFQYFAKHIFAWSSVLKGASFDV